MKVNVDDIDLSKLPVSLREAIQAELGATQPITIELDEWMTKAKEVTFDIYRQKNEGLISDDDVEVALNRIAQLTRDYILTRAAEKLDGRKHR